jgi:hypothetical protein
MKTVKKYFMIMATFLLLAIFFAFSSGIVITIHHCCHYCQKFAEKTSCSRDGNCCCCSGENEDNVDSERDTRSHDTQYFFKILDNYIKTNLSFFSSWKYFQTNVVDNQSDIYDSILYKTLIKEYLKIPPSFHLQGISFLDFCLQRVYYA